MSRTPTPTSAHPKRPRRVAVVMGTRPEAIKLAPVVQEMRKHPEEFSPLLLSTSQHRELLRQALKVFDLQPDIDLDLMRPGEETWRFTARATLALGEWYDEHRPDLVVVQGDTGTVAAAATSAFYHRIPVAHVEAGLRSRDLTSPFPEEFNRRVASVASTLHFAPTARAQANLLSEGVIPDDVYVTGNTVVDALRRMPAVTQFAEPELREIDWSKRIVLVTVHRRESHGAALMHICEALIRIAHRHPDLHFALPVHPNPNVRETVYRRLEKQPRIHLFTPLSYIDVLEVVRRSWLVLSDSGGLQEEAPSFKKPILILRDRTERPEVVDSGFGVLVGTATNAIVEAVEKLIRDPEEYRTMTSGENPFGDGHAAERIVRIIQQRIPRRDVGHAPMADDANSRVG